MSVKTCWTRRAGICQACDVIVYMVRCSFYGDARTYQSHGNALLMTLNAFDNFHSVLVE